MAEKGKPIVLVIGIYLIIKSVLNLLMGFSFGNLLSLIIAAALAALLICRVRYANWIVGAVCILVVLLHLLDNLRGLPGTWIYLAEAALDVGAAAVLFASPDVRALYDGQNRQ